MGVGVWDGVGRYWSWYSSRCWRGVGVYYKVGGVDGGVGVGVGIGVGIGGGVGGGVGVVLFCLNFLLPFNSA